eukprot:TRINITY_DN12397_c2_g2_i1.p3 TRINITY_DN12397_c2_g2~~TRINITY_DN12397_c2_g2_i1.p3  ORF type:complete len:145 (+),score=34.63 TRINITY_DN12397_c2_g2_i1:1463-1897(+)
MRRHLTSFVPPPPLCPPIHTPSFRPNPRLFPLSRLKNLSNVRFGRLNRRFDQRRGEAIVAALERHSIKLTDQEKDHIVRGALERDLAHSGLEDTMINSFNQILEEQARLTKLTNTDTSLRVAAMVNAINKVANVVTKKGQMLAG